MLKAHQLNTEISHIKASIHPHNTEPCLLVLVISATLSVSKALVPPDHGCDPETHNFKQCTRCLQAWPHGQ